MNPKISVITINFNNKYGLEKTLESVTSQDYTDYEYIVIDGGSTDGSKDFLETYSKNITYWVSEPDKGIYHAMNKGIAAAKGEYLIFINSGDTLYCHQTLQNVAGYLHDEDIIYSDLEFMNQEKKHIHHYPKKLNILYFIQSSLPHPATFIRKSAFERTGMYDEQLKIVSDWKWFLLGIFKFNLSYRHIDEVVSTFALDGISSSGSSAELITLERKETFREHFFLSGEDVEQILSLKRNEYKVKLFENQFNHLKNYRLVKLLDRLGLIRIPR